MKKRKIYQWIHKTNYLWKSSMAAGIAWELARLIGAHRPYFAPLAAILCVQVTVEESIYRGYERLLGIVGGIAVAEVVGRLCGINAWSIAIIVFLGVTLATVLHLGKQAIPQVGVSALMVLTIGVTHEAYAFERIGDTLIGVVVAVLVNMLLFPPDFTEPAAKSVVEAADKLAEMYETIATWLGAGAEPTHGQTVQRELWAYLKQVHVAFQDVDTAVRALRYSPLMRRRQRNLETLHEESIRLRQGYAHATGMMRTLLDWVQHHKLGQENAHVWQSRFDAVAAGVRQWTDSFAAIHEVSPSNTTKNIRNDEPQALVKRSSQQVRHERDTLSPPDVLESALVNDYHQVLQDFTPERE